MRKRLESGFPFRKNGSVFKLLRIVLVAAMFAPGCASPPANDDPPPPVSRGPASLNWVDPDAIPSPVVAPAIVPIVKPSPPAPKSAPPVAARPAPPPVAPAFTWVPLNHWAAQHKIGA